MLKNYFSKETSETEKLQLGDGKLAIQCINSELIALALGPFAGR